MLKENVEEEIVLRDNMVAQDWAEDVERCGNDIIVLQQWRKDLEVLYTSEQMKVTVEKGIQTKMFQQGIRMDEEIDELWHLMHRCKRNGNDEVHAVIWMIVEDWEVQYRINEQILLQNKFLDPGILQIEDYDLEVTFLFPGESDAGASCSPFQIPSSMLDQA